MSLTNLVIYIMIAALLAVIGIPATERYIVRSSIAPVAETLQRYIATVKTNGQGESATPYNGLTQESMAREVEGDAIKVDATTGALQHGLGGGKNGTITISETGDTASFTLADISSYACPGFPSAIQKIIKTVKINGKIVKDTDASDRVTTEYTSAKASAACTRGDTNEVVLTIR